MTAWMAGLSTRQVKRVMALAAERHGGDMRGLSRTECREAYRQAAIAAYGMDNGVHVSDTYSDGCERTSVSEERHLAHDH
jgi:hypothetical protein